MKDLSLAHVRRLLLEATEQVKDGDVDGAAEFMIDRLSGHDDSRAEEDEDSPALSAVVSAAREFEKSKSGTTFTTMRRRFGASVAEFIGETSK